MHISRIQLIYREYSLVLVVNFLIIFLIFLDALFKIRVCIFQKFEIHDGEMSISDFIIAVVPEQWISAQFLFAFHELFFHFSDHIGLFDLDIL